MDYEKLHAREEDISTKVHALVNELTGDLSPDEDTEVRAHLTETFRFWRKEG